MQHDHTITLADASSHTITQSGVVAEDKLTAALNALQAMQTQTSELAALVTTDTWTVTVTQP